MVIGTYSSLKASNNTTGISLTIETACILHGILLICQDEIYTLEKALNVLKSIRKLLEGKDN